METSSARRGPTYPPIEENLWMGENRSGLNFLISSLSFFSGPHAQEEIDDYWRTFAEVA
jgi:hypothetical protein